MHQSANKWPAIYTVVARAGVEPATFRVSVGRSYQLSYLAVADVPAAMKRGFPRILGDPDRT